MTKFTHGLMKRETVRMALSDGGLNYNDIEMVNSGLAIIRAYMNSRI